MDIDETGLVPFQKLLLRCWYQAHMLGSPQVAYPENGVSAWTWVKMVTVHWQYSLGDVNMRRVSRQTSRWRPFGPDTRLRGGCPGLLEWMVSSVLEASQHQEPRGATGNARGELLTGSSVATGAWTSMKIIPGNRNLSFTRRQVSPTGATDDRPVAGCPAAGDIGFPSWGISPTRRAVGGAQRSQRERPPRRTIRRGFRRHRRPWNS